ncbi:MAG: hypothetical protein BV457_09435 [Thermoplasmata archaeon M9B1D]|nr:MAG: hypothetical protein BV457_09435 [Thermoplasmata archaeon M9B1D]PNX49555.1 MAG: hypothetical protein BV456_08845 [Thermoplasmata archaeon M8B2D]
MDNINDRITVVDSQHANGILDRNDIVEVYLYKDYGAGHFGNLAHLIEAKNTFTNLYGIGFFWGMSNFIGGFGEHVTNNEEYFIIYFYQDGVSKKIRLEYSDGVAGGSDDYLSPLPNTMYYFEVVRGGTSFYAKIYSDSDRTILLDTISYLCSSNLTEYIYVLSSRYTAQAGRQTTTDVYNLDLQEVTPTTSDKNIPKYFNSKYITHH